MGRDGGGISASDSAFIACMVPRVVPIPSSDSEEAGYGEQASRAHGRQVRGALGIRDLGERFYRGGVCQLAGSGGMTQPMMLTEVLSGQEQSGIAEVGTGCASYVVGGSTGRQSMVAWRTTVRGSSTGVHVPCQMVSA